MSMERESHVLELDSQLELLERLQLLTNFGSNFVTVSGSQGAGKTWLVQRYLEVWAADKNQALLMNFSALDEAQRRFTILSQLVSEPLFNPADGLAESFAHLMDGENCDIVIAIDDAHVLSESFISELWMLVLEAQHSPLWTINVLLFAESGAGEKLDAVLTRLSYGQEQKPIGLDIEQLSEQEADRFFERLVIRYVDDDMEKRVRHAYRTVARRPGDIMALGDYKVEKRIIIRSIVGSPLNIALVVLILLVVIGGGYAWLMLQPSPDDKADRITQSTEQTVIPTLPQAESEESPLATLEAEDDSASLPPSVTDEVTSVGDTDSQQQRVVINSEVVDALLEGKEDTVDTSAIQQVVEESTPKQATQPDTPEAQASKPEESTPEKAVPGPEESKSEVTQVEDAEDSKEPKSEQQVSFTEEVLKNFSPSSYTLQLAALTSTDEVRDFLQTYKLKDKVYIYPTIRNEAKWFIVTFDNFSSIQGARDAVGTLSKELQSLDPWAKSLRQVQSELERGK